MKEDDNIQEKLNDYFKDLSESLNIADSYLEKAGERVSSLNNWLSSHEDNQLFKVNIYFQGSFNLKTVVKPINNEDCYDVDLVLELSGIDFNIISPKKFKDFIGKILIQYCLKNNFKEPLEEKKPCFRFNYSDEVHFHIDILPALTYIDGSILITDNEDEYYSNEGLGWQNSNPKGYSEWFFNLKENQILNFLYNKNPNINNDKNTVLQDVIKIIKRHRDTYFQFNNSDYKPISIIITTLAALSYNGENNLLEALVNIVQKMDSFIQVRGNYFWISNPVNPKENFADKWIKTPYIKSCFDEWIASFKDLTTKIRDFYLLDSEQSSSLLKSFEKIFNKEFIDEQVIIKNINHIKKLDWRYDNQGSANIHAFYSKNTFSSNKKGHKFSSNYFSLNKEYYLKFECRTTIVSPDKISWQVTNTGEEAMKDDALRGDFYDSNDKGNIRFETTKYKGTHFVECFVIKNETCVAKSGRFLINIK